VKRIEQPYSGVHCSINE